MRRKVYRRLNMKMIINEFVTRNPENQQSLSMPITKLILKKVEPESRKLLLIF